MNKRSRARTPARDVKETGMGLEGGPQMETIRVIDADGHVLESDREIEQYFEGPYKGHKRSGTFPIFPSLDG